MKGHRYFVSYVLLSNPIGYGSAEITHPNISDIQTIREIEKILNEGKEAPIIVLNWQRFEHGEMPT